MRLASWGALILVACGEPDAPASFTPIPYPAISSSTPVPPQTAPTAGVAPPSSTLTAGPAPTAPAPTVTAALPRPTFDDASADSAIVGLWVQSSELPAKPILGGTLLALRSGGFAIAADPDRDRIHVVDLNTLEPSASIELLPDDEPGRLVEGPDEIVYVALRRGGAIVAIDPHTGVLLNRFEICAAPRGLSFDHERDEIVVACHSGQLSRMNTAGVVTWGVQLPSDLRDVVVSGNRYWVSRLKTAELIEVDPATGVAQPARRPATLYPPEDSPRNADGSFPTTPGVHESRLARRMLVGPDGDLILFHQRANIAQLSQVYYASNGDLGGGVVQGVVTQFSLSARDFVPRGALASGQHYDLAFTPDGSHLATFFSRLSDSVVLQGAWSSRSDLGVLERGTWESTPIEGQASALAYDPTGRLLVQLREPAALEIVGVKRVELSDDSRWDTGHVLFHSSTFRGVACTSCHPEGGEDGVTWDFAGLGLRQTQPLQGGILSTAPLHWQGDRATIQSLMLDTYTSRMGGGTPSASQAQALGLWLDRLQFPTRTPSPPERILQGRQLFERFECHTCHSGPLLTDNQNHDVGTGGAFQTPPLVGLRDSAPYMHDGCAHDLRARFDQDCGGPQHGALTQATSDELDALVSYLEEL